MDEAKRDDSENGLHTTTVKATSASICDIGGGAPTAGGTRSVLGTNISECAIFARFLLLTTTGDQFLQQRPQTVQHDGNLKTTNYLKPQFSNSFRPFLFRPLLTYSENFQCSIEKQNILSEFYFRNRRDTVHS